MQPFRRFGSALAAILTLCIITALPAAASYVSDAATALKNSPIYVHPDMRSQLSPGDEQALRQRITSGRSPVYVALLPEAALADTGGNADALPQAVGNLSGQRGTVAVVVQLLNGRRGLRASSSVLEEGVAKEQAELAAQSKGSQGMAAVLTDFVSRVQREANRAAQPAGSPSGNEGATAEKKSGTSGWLILLIVISVLAALGLLIWGLAVRSRRKEEERQEAEVFSDEKAASESAYSALGNDVLTQSSMSDPEAMGLYDKAAERWRWAGGKLATARTLGDLAAVRDAVSLGQRYMNEAVAINSGKQSEIDEPAAQLRRSSRSQAGSKSKAKSGSKSGNGRSSRGKQEQRTDVPPPDGRATVRNYRTDDYQGELHWYGGGRRDGTYWQPGYYPTPYPWMGGGYMDPITTFLVMDAIMDDGHHHHDAQSGSGSDVSSDHGAGQYDGTENTPAYESSDSGRSYDQGGGADFDGDNSSRNPEPEPVSVDTSPSYSPPTPSYDPPSYDSGGSYGGGYDSGGGGGYDGGGGGDF